MASRLASLDGYDRRTLMRIKNKISVNGETGCWEWQGTRNWRGYGTVGYRGRVAKVHRITYALFVSEIAAGFVLDHFACENRACCNPKHVRPVTPRENALRGTGIGSTNMAKASCRSGHEYSEENTYINVHGHRVCKTCSRASHRAAYHRNKSAPESAIAARLEGLERTLEVRS